MADALSLLFELDADGKPAVAEFQRVRKAFAGEIAALRKTVAQSFTLPPIKLPTSPTAAGRGQQVDAHVKEFRRIEAEAAKSAKAQEKEQQRLNAAVESLQRQRTAALVRAFKDEERAAVASAKAQERAVTASLKAQERAASAAAKAQEQAARQAAARVARAPQVDQHVRDFKRIEAERQRAAKAAEVAAARSARAQEREERRKNAAIASLDRQRSAAFIAQRKIEERAAIAAARAQERAAQQASRAIANAFRGIGPGLRSVGRTLSIGITAPLLALGAASLKSAKDLDAQVNTLRAFTGSAQAAERRLAELIKTARQTPGLTTNLALTLDAYLRTANATEESINKVLPAIGRLNAVSKLQDPQRFVQNLVQLVTQDFERIDLKELVGQSPIAGQVVAELFNVDSPLNAKAIRESARKMGITTVAAFFTAFAETAERNQGLRDVTESIGTRFEKIVDRVTVALRPLGLSILNAIQPFVEPIAKLVERIGEAFNSLSEPVKTAIIVIAGIAAVVGPVLFVLGGLATAITAVVSAIGTIAAAVAAVGLPVILAGVAALAVAIGSLVAAAVALRRAWQTNFGGIRDTVLTTVEAIRNAFNDVLPNILSLTEKVTTGIRTLWERFGPPIVDVVETAFGIITRRLRVVIEIVSNMIVAITKLIDGDWRGAWTSFTRIVEVTVEGIGFILGSIVGLIARSLSRAIVAILTAIPKFAAAGARLGESLIKGFIDFVRSPRATLQGAAAVLTFLSAIVSPFTLGIAVVAGTSIGRAFVRGFVDGAAKASETIQPVTISAAFPKPKTIAPAFIKKPPPREPPPGAGAKGEDQETRRRIRLLELEAERAEAIARQRINAENIFFEQRKTSLKEFTDFQIAEEEIVFEKKKAIFAAERIEAQKLRKGRDLALGEIRLKELKAELEFADRRNQLLANQESEELEAAKAHRQALLDIQDEGDQRQLELIDSYVERYLISYEEAEKRRLAIEEKARERRRAELEIQLGEAGENVQERQRVADAIARIDAESATAKEEAENRKRRALRATIEAENEYYETLIRITLAARAILRDAADIELGRLVSRFGDRRKFRLEALRREREANEEEHQERLRQIEQEKLDAEKRLEGVRDAEEKLLALRRYYADLEKAENERRAAERQREDDDERDVRDPFSSLRQRFENFQFDIQNTNDAIADSLESLSEQVNSSINTMVDAFHQAVVANILYGESIGKALKAALAQQLAAISAEAAIQSLKHAAYALGSLAFGNFAAAGKHAAAAAAFGALAIAAGLAGRALSRSAGLYDRGRKSGTASTAVGGGAQNREFQYGGAVESSSVAAREGSARTGVGGMILSLAEDVKRARHENALLTAKLDGTLSRINSMPAGQVVTIGAADAQGAIGTAVIGHSNSDGDFNEQLQRNLGFA